MKIENKNKKDKQMELGNEDKNENKSNLKTK